MIQSDVSALSPDSLAMVTVACDGDACIDDCEGVFEARYCDLLKRRSRRHLCDACLQKPRSSAEGSTFSLIDTEAKAYLFAWIAVSDSSDSVFVNLRSAPYELHAAFEETVCVKARSEADGSLTFPSRRFTDDVRFHLASHENPLFESHLLWHFIRGCLDASGQISTYPPECCLFVPRCCELQRIVEFVGIPCVAEAESRVLQFQGTNCIDLLGKLYAGMSESPHRTDHKYHQYVQCLTARGSPWARAGVHLPACRVIKSDKYAVLPSKTNHSDVGYDITVIRKVKSLNAAVTLYDTGLRVSPPPGYYVEIVPRSSLSKSGFALANSVGVIDPSYTGNLLVALARISDDAPAEPELPFRCCQMIVRRQVHVDVVECVEEANNTARGAGGFGSTPDA